MISHHTTAHGVDYSYTNSQDHDDDYFSYRRSTIIRRTLRSTYYYQTSRYLVGTLYNATQSVSSHLAYASYIDNGVPKYSLSSYYTLNGGTTRSLTSIQSTTSSRSSTRTYLWGNSFYGWTNSISSTRSATGQQVLTSQTFSPYFTQTTTNSDGVISTTRTWGQSIRYVTTNEDGTSESTYRTTTEVPGWPRAANVEDPAFDFLERHTVFLADPGEVLVSYEKVGTSLQMHNLGTSWSSSHGKVEVGVSSSHSLSRLTMEELSYSYQSLTYITRDFTSPRVSQKAVYSKIGANSFQYTYYPLSLKTSSQNNFHSMSTRTSDYVYSDDLVRETSYLVPFQGITYMPIEALGYNSDGDSELFTAVRALKTSYGLAFQSTWEQLKDQYNWLSSISGGVQYYRTSNTSAVFFSNTTGNNTSNVYMGVTKHVKDVRYSVQGYPQSNVIRVNYGGNYLTTPDGVLAHGTARDPQVFLPTQVVSKDNTSMLYVESESALYRSISYSNNSTYTFSDTLELVTLDRGDYLMLTKDINKVAYNSPHLDFADGGAFTDKAWGFIPQQTYSAYHTPRVGVRVTFRDRTGGFTSTRFAGTETAATYQGDVRVAVAPGPSYYVSSGDVAFPVFAIE